MRQLIVLLIFLLLAAFALAQEATNEAEPASATPILPFRSYDAGWTRYRNLDAAGEALLEIDDIRVFPFRWIIADAPTGIDEMADLLPEIPDFDESALAGKCDTARLKPASTDALCVPGTAQMPYGHIVLALYHPETGELAALTTSIDNTHGGATKADWSPTAVPAAADESASGCGPYADGQWIKAADYEASGLSLPVDRDGHDLDKITDYVCVVGSDGSAHLVAYSLSGVKFSGTNGAVNGANGANGANGRERDTGSDTDQDGGYIIVPTEEPCTDPFGCDDDTHDE